MIGASNWQFVLQAWSALQGLSVADIAALATLAVALLNLGVVVAFSQRQIKSADDATARLVEIQTIMSALDDHTTDLLGYQRMMQFETKKAALENLSSRAFHYSNTCLDLWDKKRIREVRQQIAAMDLRPLLDAVRAMGLDLAGDVDTHMFKISTLLTQADSSATLVTGTENAYAALRELGAEFRTVAIMASKTLAAGIYTY